MFENTALAYYIAALFLGSVPTGYIAAHILGRESIFPPGERSPKNSGEVFRILGRGVGLFVTFLDFMKGFISVSLLVYFFLGKEGYLDWRVISLGASAVVLGHVFSFWLGFRGGKGFSTSYGVLVFLFPVPAICAGLVWGCLAFWGLSTRPGTLSAAAAMPLFTVLWVLIFDYERLFYLYLVAFLSILVIFEYRAALIRYLGLSKMAKESET